MTLEHRVVSFMSSVLKYFCETTAIYRVMWCHCIDCSNCNMFIYLFTSLPSIKNETVGRVVRMTYGESKRAEGFR